MFFVTITIEPKLSTGFFVSFSCQFKCCGSNSSSDWASSVWIRSSASNGRKVPDSCCKSVTEMCGLRDHPSNIYKVEVGENAVLGETEGLFSMKTFVCQL